MTCTVLSIVCTAVRLVMLPPAQIIIQNTMHACSIQICAHSIQLRLWHILVIISLVVGVFKPRKNLNKADFGTIRKLNFCRITYQKSYPGKFFNGKYNIHANAFSG